MKQNLNFNQALTPLRNRVLLHIPQEKEYNKNGIIIDTRWNPRMYAPQYSKVVGVSREVEGLSVGEMVYHHDQIAQKPYLVDGEDDIFWCEFNDNDIIGTDEKMFFDNVLTEPIYKKESKELVVGNFGSALEGDFKIQEIKEYEKNKVRVVRGKGMDGKVFYCSNLVAYTYKRTDSVLYFSKFSQLICDEEMNCTPDKTVIKRDIEGMKLKGGVWVNQTEKVKTGTVVSSHNPDIKKGARILYGVWKTFDCNGEELDVAKDSFLFGIL